jgi:carbon storage regulator
MLVLTRRPSEQIIIDNNIRLTIVSVGPGRVKIGIEAPPHVRIDRSEIHDRIQKEVTGTAEPARPAAPVVGTAEDPAPLVVAAAATAEAPALHNRIADKLPAEAPVNRLLRHRLPNKPR